MDEEKENPPNKADLYTRDDLNSCILMSQNELDSALSDIGAIEVKGYLRICSENVTHNLNKALINTIIENDWPLNNIKLNDCLNELPDVDETLLKRSLSYLGSQIDLDDPTWNLNPSLLSSAAAHILFRENPKKKVSELILSFFLSITLNEKKNSLMTVIYKLGISSIRFHGHLGHAGPWKRFAF